MAEDTSTATATQTTSDGDGKNTSEVTTAGGGTQTATTSEADEKRFTQADVETMFQKRLAKAVKAEIRKMSGETEGQPTVEELQRRAEAAEGEARTLRAKDTVIDYVSDPKNKMGARNPRAIYNLIRADLEFDDEGKITNLTECLRQAKQDAPELFQQSQGSINGGAGRQSATTADMDGLIRQRAGY